MLAPLIMKLIRKMQGKKRDKSDFKGNVVPQQEQDEYTSFTADLTSRYPSGAFLGNKRDRASSNGATRIL